MPQALRTAKDYVIPPSEGSRTPDQQGQFLASFSPLVLVPVQQRAAADMSCLVTAANGPLPSRSNQASPGPLVPNGKPTSPYNERSNPISSSAQIAAQTVSSRDPKAAAQAASDMRNVVRRKLTGYVGFANLPNQWHRKSVRKGFNFNVMVVGELLKIPYIQQTIDSAVQVNRDSGNPP